MSVKKWVVRAALCCILLLPLMATGCSDTIATINADFKDFSRVDIQNFFDAQITKGSYSVTITSSEALRDYISISKQGDTLVVRLTPNHPFTDFVHMRKMLKAVISMPEVRGVALSGASRAILKGFESTQPLGLDVSGASSLTLDGTKAGTTDIRVSGSSKVNGTLTATDASFTVEGASRVSLEGTANTVAVEASGASVLELERFVHKAANMEMSGSSQATIDARDSLDFSLSGAARLYFLSNPKTGQVDVTGAATVKHKP